MWDAWLPKHGHLVARSTGSKWDAWPPKHGHLFARSTGSKWDDWRPEHRHLVARSTECNWENYKCINGKNCAYLQHQCTNRIHTNMTSIASGDVYADDVNQLEDNIYVYMNILI
jgi:hypothetical protein